jgi:hypothetical protein
MNSFFHLYECGYPYNRIDTTPLTVGTPELDDDPVAYYLGYYN